MTASQLKAKLDARGSKWFSRENMKFAGDTMRNFGVRSATVDGVDCWQVYRKNPVKHGLVGVCAHFAKDDYRQVRGTIS